jgi:MFS transporter, DHA1 family, staphyloferrin A biosynthesis exporter
MIGQWSTLSMEIIARTYLVYDITGSAAKLGIMSLASVIPIIIFSLYGGIVADRFPKKTIILICQIGLSFVTLGYAIVVSVGYLGMVHPESWWVLTAGSVMIGTITAIGMPSRQAIIPELVRREHVMNAISLSTLGMSLLQLIGPVTAGFIIKSFGYRSLFFIMTALNVSGILFAAFLPRSKPSSASVQSVMTNLVDGCKYVVRHKIILLILILVIVSIIFALPYQTLMPIFARDILKVGVTGQGTLMSIMGFGAIGISLVLASIPSRKRGSVLLIANLLLGVSLIIFAFSVSWPVSIGMMVIVGMGQTINNNNGIALIQAYTDPKHLGLVLSVMSTSFGLGSLGTFFAGIIAQKVGAPWAIGGLAAILALFSFYMYLFIPKLRKLD